MTIREQAQLEVDKYAIIISDRWTFSSEDIYKAKQCAKMSINDKISYAKTFGDVTDSDIQEMEDLLKEIETI